MRKLFSLAVAGLLATALPLHAASGGASKAEAEAMVKKGIAYLKKNGPDATFREANTKGGMFSDRDLYLTIYDMDGVVKAHGTNPRMVGKSLIDMRDVDGKAFVRERVELARSKGSFWQEYKFNNPDTQKIEPKLTYCEREQAFIFCAGVYK
ncbi:cache domain-containing protein [Massilia sp. TS11]|uniref:cache domain-containing protein n=1 Tax=Massilia sp. TS11 TaxID=2908003 RepID=UPI001EDC4E6F|nr:cache domain-containing protein [Massilia sp. TS11]MCG2583711.1 cache domain-containing protein [Massilia sp. TS11]